MQQTQRNVTSPAIPLSVLSNYILFIRQVHKHAPVRKRLAAHLTTKEICSNILTAQICFNKPQFIILPLSVQFECFGANIMLNCTQRGNGALMICPGHDSPSHYSPGHDPDKPCPQLLKIVDICFSNADK